MINICCGSLAFYGSLGFILNNMEETEKEIIAENERRMQRDAQLAEFDPFRGVGSSGERVEVPTPLADLPVARVPVEMTRDAEYSRAERDGVLWQRLRCRHDFEYWCARCVTIVDKLSGQDVPLILNRPQRRLVAAMEGQRRAGRPIRAIVLKARQWGGSTVTQMMMAWLQSCHRRNWNSVICAHVKDTAATIRGMYSKMLQDYPRELWEGDAEPQFKSYERALNIREIVGRGCRVTLGSSENQDSVRGSNYAMAHLSEVAFYNQTPQKSPTDFIRAICGSIAYHPYTLVVMESTANGVGNFFHTEWLRNVEGKGDKAAVFVPWYEIDIYRLAPPDPWQFYCSMTDYERYLWQELGLTLDRIYWYHCKSAEYAQLEQMQAEFPTTAEEAFINSGCNVFDNKWIERLRQSCRPARTGELDRDGNFSESSCGRLQLWAGYDCHSRYVVSVDIGGRTARADWSVITVMRKDIRHEVVAQWRGHIDHDLLAEKAVALGRMYGNALLIIESNTLESEAAGGTDNLFVLDRLRDKYPNLYCRPAAFDSTDRSPQTRVGFHTNRSTKAILIDGLIEAVRDSGYIERDQQACNELVTYEQRPNGSYGARLGHHDDILMTRAMALWALRDMPATRVADCRRHPSLKINYTVW